MKKDSELYASTNIQMYNPDVLNCVLCTPIEEYPEFCPKCGCVLNPEAVVCSV